MHHFGPRRAERNGSYFEREKLIMGLINQNHSGKTIKDQTW
jgi:hypothetical protein